MSLVEFGGLFIVWLLSILFIGTLTLQEFRRVRFSFNVFFFVVVFADVLFRLPTYLYALFSL